MFTIKRFSEQFMLLFHQNKNRHLLILGIFVGIQFFGFIKYFTGVFHQDIAAFYNTSTVFSVILCILACQDVFNKLRSTSSGIQYLMLPATTVEKYTAAWLYSLVFTFLAVQATFVVTQIVGIGIGNMLTGMDSSFGFPEWKTIQDVLQTVIYAHALFFFGSILFRKNPIVKTIGSYIGIVFVVTLCFAWYAKHYLFGVNWANDDRFILHMDGSLGSSINGTPIMQFMEFIGLNIKWIMATITLLLWSGAYILLHKKQI